MDAGIAFQSESCSSKDNVFDLVFIDDLGPYTHDRVRCQPSIVTLLHYYDS